VRLVGKNLCFWARSAGKTVITNYLTSGTLDRTFKPTLAPDPQMLVLKQLKSRIWDMPGQQKFREMWVKYVTGSKVLVHVVDTADADRFDEAYQELNKLVESMGKDNAAFPPLIELFHKTDIQGSSDRIATIKAKYLKYDIYPGQIIEMQSSIKDPGSLDRLKDQILDLLV
jgi:GTPase SAR1 family protein